MKLVNINTIKNINKANYYKLRRWYEEIKDYEELTINEAKTLNRLILESSGEIREIYRNRLILGTIYLIYNFVCKSGFTAVRSSDFDVDDIMNTSIEIWINMLDSNILLNENVKHYSELFLKVFYTKLTKHLIGKNINYSSNDINYNFFDECIFGDILKYYLDCINNESITDEKSEFNCILHALGEYQILRKISSTNLSLEEKNRLICKIYLVFKNIKKIVDIEDISRLSKTKLDFLKLLLFHTSIFDKDTKLISIDDFTPEIDTKILIHNILQSADLPEREKEILMLRHDINGKYCHFIDSQYREIADSLGITHARVQQLENKCIRRIQKLLL